MSAKDKNIEQEQEQGISGQDHHDLQDDRDEREESLVAEDLTVEDEQAADNTPVEASEAAVAQDIAEEAEEAQEEPAELAPAEDSDASTEPTINADAKEESAKSTSSQPKPSAAALQADLYENWTDVPGVLTADPKIDPYAKPIPHLTYSELSALAEKGLQVLHEGAVRPVREKGIPMRIASSFQPELPGTWISGE